MGKPKPAQDGDYISTSHRWTLKRLKHHGVEPFRSRVHRREGIMEAAFAEEWEKQCKPQRGLNDGVGTLQQLFVSEGRMTLAMTQRDATVAATVIQWLGTSIGTGFLRRALARGGEVIVDSERDIEAREWRMREVAEAWETAQKTLRESQKVIGELKAEHEAIQMADRKEHLRIERLLTEERNALREKVGRLEERLAQLEPVELWGGGRRVRRGQREVDRMDEDGLDGGAAVEMSAGEIRVGHPGRPGRGRRYRIQREASGQR